MDSIQNFIQVDREWIYKKDLAISGELKTKADSSWLETSCPEQRLSSISYIILDVSLFLAIGYGQ
ncbi:MAG: hypothetical protein C4332_03635 [Meiothermus sp.]